MLPYKQKGRGCSGPNTNALSVVLVGVIVDAIVVLIVVVMVVIVAGIVVVKVFHICCYCRCN